MNALDAGRVLRPSAAEALEAWRALVEADAEQVARLSELSLEGDYYAPRAAQFRPDTRPSDEMAYLAELARPGQAWRDVGAGGGRLAVPLAQLVRRVYAVEPSAAMRDTLALAAEAARVTSKLEITEERWPPEDLGAVPPADVTLSANAIYDIADIGPFLEAIEATTTGRCVVVLHDRARGAHWNDAYRAAHGEDIAALPAFREFLAVLGALGRTFEVRTFPSAASEAPPLPEEQALLALRRICWLTEGSPKDERLQAYAREHYAAGEGLLRLPPARRYTGVVSWRPRA